MLTISSDAKLVKNAFDIWRSALLEHGIRDGNLWRLPEQRIVFRNQSNAKSEQLGQRTALGTDPTGTYWAVQINEADTPGDANVLSAIATNENGRAFLLRQGRLTSPIAHNPSILEAEFRQLTGLTPEDVSKGDTSGKMREWYVVTALDVGGDEIRNATGRFVDRCAHARNRGNAGEGLPDTTPEHGFANDETGGSYTVKERDAQEARKIRRRQGEVWQQLAVRLRNAGIAIDKPKHAQGYEVDAVVAGPRCPLLIEIKSGTSAADVYGGMGQLQLYPKLLPKLGSHQLILLLPGLPQPALVNAIKQCEVRLCTYNIIEMNEGFKVAFDEQFMELCGLI